MLALSIPCHRHHPGDHNISDVGRQDFYCLQAFGVLCWGTTYKNKQPLYPSLLTSKLISHAMGLWPSFEADWLPYVHSALLLQWVVNIVSLLAERYDPYLGQLCTFWVCCDRRYSISSFDFISCFDLSIIDPTALCVTQWQTRLWKQHKDSHRWGFSIKPVM